MGRHRECMKCGCLFSVAATGCPVCELRRVRYEPDPGELALHEARANIKELGKENEKLKSRIKGLEKQRRIAFNGRLALFNYLNTMQRHIIEHEGYLPAELGMFPHEALEALKETCWGQNE